MSHLGLVNLAQRLLNQTLGQGQDPRVTSKTATTAANKNDRPLASGDQFTPSTHTDQSQNTAQAAGLFQVSESTLFSAAAQFLFTQTATPAQNAVPAPAAQPTVTTQPAAKAVSSAAIVPSPAPPTTAGTSTLAPTTPASPLTTPATATAAAPDTVAAIQAQLQGLNNALAALGIPQSDFARIDQIAAIINDFSPVAFSALVTQLEALAQAVSQQPAAAAAKASTSAAAPAVATPAATNSANAPAANTGGSTTNPASFQISELSIRFTGVNETLQTGSNGSGQNSGGNTTSNFSASAN